MSVLEQVDADTRSILERYHFDEELFERLRAQVAAGELSPESNYVRGEIEPLRPDELVRLDEAGEDVREVGVRALRGGEVAMAVLNGGMATRFGGVVKGIVDAYGGKSFLEWKLLQARRVGEELGREVPCVVMNSFATDEATREFISSLDVPEPLYFKQSVSLRMNRDGSLFIDDDGTAAPYSPGHGDFVD